MKVNMKATMALLIAGSVVAIPAFAKTHHHRHRHHKNTTTTQSYNGYHTNGYTNTNGRNNGYNNTNGSTNSNWNRTRNQH